MTTRESAGLQSLPAERSRERWTLLIGLLVVAYFAARLVYFALVIDPLVPPDEVTHVGRSQAYATAWAIPADSEATYEFGLMGHRPPLFYLLMGKVLQISPLPVSDLTLLRLANCLLGLATVFFGYRWIALLNPLPSVRLLFLVMMTNVLMFTGVSASVSYDNLTNLLAAMSIYYLSKYFLDGRPEQLMAAQAAIFAGCLTKTAFLPLAAILEAAFIVKRWRTLGDLPRRLRESLSPWRWRRAALYAAAVVGLVATAFLYADNLLSYGRLAPRENQVLELDQAMKYRIFARNFIVRQFRQGELTYEEAMQQTDQIDNPGNRRRARNLLWWSRDPERLRASILGPAGYVLAWTRLMLADGMGYHGHRVIRQPASEIAPLVGILLVAGVIFIRKWRREEAGGLITVAWAVTILYLMVLMWLVNYRLYFRAGMLDYALQGRYAFPLLVPICGLVAYYLLTYLPSRTRWLVALLAAGYFMRSDLPFFLAYTDRCWFEGSQLTGCYW